MDKFTIRGIVYIIISLIGLSYEIFWADHVRVLPLVAYLAIIGIGLFCIFIIKEQKE